MKTLYRHFRVTPVKGLGYLSFCFLNFRYFKNSNFPRSERQNIFFFGAPCISAPLVFLLYVLRKKAIRFRVVRFFVKFKEHVVGVFALQERRRVLHIISLAVAPEYRRRRIGTYVLTWIQKLVKRMNKDWLELSVLKWNTPALRLYTEFGFRIEKEKKWSFVLRKS